MDFLLETLPLVVGVLPLPYLFFPHLPSEQVLWVFAVEATPASLAKPEVMAILALVPLVGSALELVPH